MITALFLIYLVGVVLFTFIITKQLQKLIYENQIIAFAFEMLKAKLTFILAMMVVMWPIVILNSIFNHFYSKES